MRNDRGMTLMETMMAILILSIAGLIITTGIASVIRVMGDANTVKNQSDMLLSKAEKTDKELSKDVKEATSPFNGTTITNSFGTSVKVDYKLTQYDIISEGKVTLRGFKSSLGNTVIEEFPDIINKASSFYALVKSTETRQPTSAPFSYMLKEGTIPAYNYVLYPKGILPAKEQGTSYYLKAYYPWEYNNMTTGGKPSHNGLLIYLSVYPDFKDSWESEKLHFVYHYEEQAWYYNASNDYQLTYKIIDHFGMQMSALTRSDDKSIRDWETLKSHLESESFGWKKLDVDAKYNASNPDDVWK